MENGRHVTFGPNERINPGWTAASARLCCIPRPFTACRNNNNNYRATVRLPVMLIVRLVADKIEEKIREPRDFYQRVENHPLDATIAMVDARARCFPDESSPFLPFYSSIVPVLFYLWDN